MQVLVIHKKIYNMIKIKKEFTLGSHIYTHMESLHLPSIDTATVDCQINDIIRVRSTWDFAQWESLLAHTTCTALCQKCARE